MQNFRSDYLHSVWPTVPNQAQQNDSEPTLRPDYIWAKLGLALIVSAAFAAVFASVDGFADAWKRLQGVDLSVLSIALLLMIFAQITRAARLSVLIAGHGVPSLRIFSLSVLHAFLASLLPMRIGELALVLLLKRHHQMTFTGGLGVLIGTKVLDLQLLLAIGCFSAAWIMKTNGDNEAGLIVVTLLVGAMAVFGFLMLPLSRSALRTVSRAMAVRGWNRIAGFIDELISAYSNLGRRQTVALQVTTVLLWGLFLTSFHLCALAVNGTPGVLSTFASAVAGSFAFALPINGLAQFGPFEAAWVAAAKFLSGADISRSLPAALLVHGATLSVAGLLSCVTSLWLFREEEGREVKKDAAT